MPNFNEKEWLTKYILQKTEEEGIVKNIFDKFLSVFLRVCKFIFVKYSLYNANTRDAMKLFAFNLAISFLFILVISIFYSFDLVKTLSTGLIFEVGLFFFSIFVTENLSLIEGDILLVNANRHKRVLLFLLKYISILAIPISIFALLVDSFLFEYKELSGILYLVCLNFVFFILYIGYVKALDDKKVIKEFLLKGAIKGEDN